MKFKHDIEAQAGFKDKDGQLGSAGQILSSTGSQTDWIDQSTISAGNAEHVVIYAKNTSGSSISKGTPVYITGTVGATDTVEIAPADAGNSAKMPAVGLLDDTLANNAFGYVITGGFMDNITTDPIDGSTPSSNDTVYVKSGGGLTLTKPTGSNLIQNVAKVGKVSGGNSGSLIVSSILRTNDVPNLTTGKIWVGTANNTAESTVVHLDETNGRMGIGTPSPSSILHVVDGAPTLKLQSSVSSTSSTISFDNSLGTREGSLIHDTGNNTFRLKNESGLSRLNLDNYSATFSVGTSNLNQSGVILGATTVTLISNFSTALTCDYVGNVGIGTTNPSAKLEVNGDIALSGDNKVYSEGDTLTLMSGGTNGTYLVVDDISGNVGVGTNSPTQALDVNGNLRLGTTGDFYISQSPFTTSTFYIRTATSGTVAFGAPASFQQNVTAQGDIYAAGGSSSTSIGTKRFGTWSNKIVDTGDNYFNLQGGNFGIGTSSPASQLGSTKVLDISSTGNGEIILDHTDAGVSSDIGLYSWNRNNDHLAHIKASCDGATDSAFISFHAQATGGSFANAASNEKMRITSTGNVGIGTTSPSYKLDVDGEVRVGDNQKLKLWDDPYGAIITPLEAHLALTTTRTQDNIYFDPGNSTKMIIEGGGNVGIGTSGPGAKLDVVSGDIRLGTNSTYFRVRDTASAQPRVLGMNSANTFYIGPIDSYAGGAIVYGASGNVTYHGFYGGGGEKVRITSAGNVGIGTTSPQEKLHVQNYTTGESHQAMFKGGAVTVGDYSYISLNNGYSAEYNKEVRLAAVAELSTSNKTGFAILTSPDANGASGHERLRVTADGNVGIGTSNPSEKLEVNGTVKATAATDAYKGYIKSVITTGYSMKSASTAYQYIPYNSYTLTTLQAYYNRTVAAYNGRVKKIIVKRIGGASADATGMKFKKEINGTVNATEYTATVLYGSGNFQATYNFGNNDFTFSAGDSIGVLMQSSGGTGMIGAGAIQIVLEYNIT